MFSSAAAANERWHGQFDSLPSTSAAASLTAIPGRKRKANFSNDETEALVRNVVRHFSDLYGSKKVRARPTRRKQLWTQIQSRVNFLGYTERSIDDLKHKWRDLRLDVQKKVMTKKSPASHRAGTSSKLQLTPLEERVASTFVQPTHDPEPEIAPDPEISFPETSKGRFAPMQASTSHPGSYSDTKEPPSTWPKMEKFVGPHPGVRSSDPSVIGECSRGEEQDSSADSGPELQISETSTVSPPPRDDSDTSEEEDAEGPEEEDAEGPDRDEGLNPPFSAEENLKFSKRQTMLFHRCHSRGSPASEPEDTLTPAGGHPKWGHNRGADLPVLGPQTEEEISEPPNTERGSFPRGPMGPMWKKQQQQPVSPLGAGSPMEEPLPPVSPGEGQASPSHSLPRRIRASRSWKSRRGPSKATVHRLMEMGHRWGHLYHHELVMWEEERAQQVQQRARARDLQLQLLAVLTEIRDELRYLRQEQTTSHQEFASQTGVERTSPRLSPKPESSLPKPWSEPVPQFYPGKPESCLVGTSFQNGGWGDRGAGFGGPQGISRRGRGRPRGSTSRPKRFSMGNR